jgi:outer membrane protein OmpA-like peptidoglycan-associated protein
MNRRLQMLFLFFVNFLFAQEALVQSVYFQFDKFKMDEIQGQQVVDFIKKADSTRIESIQIFGYTDDIGKEAYNYKLSNNRANTIKDRLILSGIKNKIIVTIEGKGRILIDDDVVENLPEVRSKNRRVDVVLNLKPLPKIVLPGFYTTLQKNHVVGDHIYLENLLFESGYSSLSTKSKNDLDKLAKILQKYKTLEFEIQGHICCTPPFQKEAIDRETRKRKLSINRAENVYKYLISKKINPKRMTFKGYGNTVPLGKGPDYDRRVELVITKI